MDNFISKYDVTKSKIIDEINLALDSVDKNNLNRLVDDIINADKIFFVGVGRVKMSLEAFAKRLSHLGFKTFVVGDITEPAITNNDLLIVGSGSGMSIVPVAIAKKAKEFGAKIVHIGSNVKGDISQYSEYLVRIPVRTRYYLDDEIKSCQIMTSLFEQVLLILGDIISQMIAEDKKIDLKSLWEFHANLE